MKIRLIGIIKKYFAIFKIKKIRRLNIIFGVKSQRIPNQNTISLYMNPLICNSIFQSGINQIDSKEQQSLLKYETPFFYLKTN